MGRAIEVGYASEGTTVVIADISQTGLDGCVREIGGPGRADDTLAVWGSVIVEREAADLVRAAMETFGRFDVLVNVVGGIAGEDFQRRFLDMDEEHWRGAFALNLVERASSPRTGPAILSGGYGRIRVIGRQRPPSSPYRRRWRSNSRRQ